MPLSYIEVDSKTQWLAQRRDGIGGSDVAAICGLSRWKSPVAVYLDKTEGLESEMGEAAYWGTVMEPILASEFTKRTGFETKPITHILVHETETWARANIDRLIYNSDDDVGILECKTASEYLYTEWKDEHIPDYYMTQLQWYFYVTGAKWGYFATLVGGNKFLQYRVERDDALIELLVDRCKRFWYDHVLARVIPPFDGTQASSDLVKRLYPNSTPDSEIDLDDQAEDLYPMLLQLQMAKKRIKIAEVDQKEAENRIKAVMQDRERAYYNGELVFTWRGTPRKFLTKNLKEVIS